MDAELLIKENMGRLIMAARKLSRNFGVPDMLDDLIQEGSLALMEAAGRYDTSGDTPFDVYSDRIIKSAMLDYIYRNATQFTMPPDRFRVLRHVARLLADGGGVQEICGDLSVSPAVARKLIDYYSGGRADQEQDDPAARPAIAGSVEDMENYDIVFLGYPIWHGQAPKIIYTFLESCDFAGKTIVSFCTSHSSPIGSSADNLHGLVSDTAEWLAGRRFGSGAAATEIQGWIDELGLPLTKTC